MSGDAPPALFFNGPALLASSWQHYTLPFAGFDPRKIGAGEGSYVTSPSGERIGTILTCTTDMGIGRIDGQIVSIADKPDFQAKGLCCGFVLVDRHTRP